MCRVIDVGYTGPIVGASGGSSCTTYGRPDRSTAARTSTSSSGISADPKRRRPFLSPNASASAAPSALTLLAGRPRLVVTRTMSKAFAFAGVRLGYLAADPGVVDAVQLVRLPYHLSALTQAAARAALAHADVLLATVEAIKAQRDRIVATLRGYGLTVADSDANFVLFGRFRDQKAVWQALLVRDVLVRDVGLPGWLRVTAGTEAETTAFLLAMKELL